MREGVRWSLFWVCLFAGAACFAAGATEINPANQPEPTTIEDFRYTPNIYMKELGGVVGDIAAITSVEF